MGLGWDLGEERSCGTQKSRSEWKPGRRNIGESGGINPRRSAGQLKWPHQTSHSPGLPSPPLLPVAAGVLGKLSNAVDLFLLNFLPLAKWARLGMPFQVLNLNIANLKYRYRQIHKPQVRRKWGEKVAFFCLLQVGRTQLFVLLFSEPGPRGLADPCRMRRCDGCAAGRRGTEAAKRWMDWRVLG